MNFIGIIHFFRRIKLNFNLKLYLLVYRECRILYRFIILVEDRSIADCGFRIVEFKCQKFHNSFIGLICLIGSIG